MERCIIQSPKRQILILQGYQTYPTLFLVHIPSILLFPIAAISFYYQKHMLKNKGRNFDNVSIAQTKSSKTLKSKLNNNPEVEVKKFDPPYFKEENIHHEIQERAKKENSKYNGLLTPNSKYNHLDKASVIVRDLLERHQITKQKLNKMKEESEKQKQIECPFQPSKKKLEKYVVQGDVIRRNEMWLQEKRKRQVLRKEELMENDLAKCTFSPDLTNNKSLIYLKNRQRSKSTLSKPKEGKEGSVSKHKMSPGKSKDLSRSTFESAKRQIYHRLLSMSEYHNPN